MNPENDVPISRRPPISGLVLGTIGFLLVLFALLALRWPIDPVTPTTVGAHIERLTTAPQGELAGAAISRVILNAGIYIILLICAVSLLAAWIRGTRGALQTLMLMAVLGLLYMAGMALYTAAALSVCGFMLILFGALLAWVVTQPSAERTTTPVTSGDSAESGENTGKTDYGIHPSAS